MRRRLFAAALSRSRIVARVVAAVVVVVASTGPARAQIDPDFPRADFTQRVRPPEPPPDAYADARGDAPNDVPHLVLGAGSHLAFATAPEVAFGVSASAELATIRWSLGAEGRYDLPATGHTTHDAQARTSLAGISFVPCARAQAIWACAVVLASRISADGTTDSGIVAGANWFSLGVGSRVAVHFGLPLESALRIGGELLFHPIPQSLRADGSVLYTESVISTTISVALVRVF